MGKYVIKFQPLTLKPRLISPSCRAQPAVREVEGVQCPNQTSTRGLKKCDSFAVTSANG